MGRTPCCDKANVKRGPWSPEEDIILKQYLEKHGTGGNWIALPRKAGLKRCGKSCRLRWLNYLKPDIKRGGFTEEEDSIISSLYFTIGSRWSVIASNMPGRTDNEIKNYWNTTLKKKLVATGHTYPINNNSTTRCGKISATSSSLNTNPTVECYSSSHSLPSLEDDSGFEITSTGNMFFRAPSSSSQELSSDFSGSSYAIAGNGGYDLSIDSLLDLDFDAIYSLISNEFPSVDQDLAEVTKPDQFMFSSTFTFNNV